MDNFWINTIMSANGIAHLSTKQLRQEAKLALAQTRRQAGGDVNKPYYRHINVLNIDLLPTKYVGNAIFDNPNPGGLQLGRPWESA